jgi:CRP-like cAMP-binding protein
MIAIMSSFTDALSPLLCERLELPAGATLFARGDPIAFLHLVESGCVHLVRVDEHGRSAVMQRATAGSLLAESSVFSATYHCDAVAVSDSVLLRGRVAALRRSFAAEPSLTQGFARHLAAEVQRTRTRLEILSRKTVREKLDAWLLFNDQGLPPPGSWNRVAEEIGVTPEAFYRELKKRRR